MRILVTGSDGFVGNYLPTEIPDRMLRIDLKNGTDILTAFQLIRDFDPEVVYHLAAHHFIPWTEEHPAETQRTNVLGTDAVLASCGPGLRAFVLASSAAVYGFSNMQVREDSALLGMGVYARTKQIAEMRLGWFADTHPEVRCVAARLFNIVGPGDTLPHLLPSIVSQHVSGKGVTVGNSWPRRDYIHVRDVVTALELLAERAPEGFSAWNVGTGIGTSVGELVTTVGKISGRKVNADVAWQKARQEDGHLVSDPSALRELGWFPMLTLDRAVSEVLRAYSPELV